jgi:hypothetical protein
MSAAFSAALRECAGFGCLAGHYSSSCAAARSEGAPPSPPGWCQWHRALAAVDVQDFARHEAGRLEIEDRVDDVGDLTHMADRVQGVELWMRLDGMHRRLDDTQLRRLHKRQGRRRCRQRPSDDAVRGLAFAPCTAAPGGVLKARCHRWQSGDSSYIVPSHPSVNARNPSAYSTHFLITNRLSFPTFGRTYFLLP